MKKQVLLIVVLIALIGTGAVFAQQPTLDKLSFYTEGTVRRVSAANKWISGAVVIPGTNANSSGNNLPVAVNDGSSHDSYGGFYGCANITSVVMLDGVTEIRAIAFRGCTGLTSVTIPASVTAIGGSAFADCTNLTSVTIQISNPGVIGRDDIFPGDLRAKYRAASGGPGTYTRQRGSDVWTKQGAVSSIDGTWRKSDGTQLVITNSAGKDNSFATLSADGRTLTIGGTVFTKQ